MENLASLLKLLFEKGSWLAAVAIVGAATATGRWLGFLDDVDKNGLHVTYLVSAVCSMVLVIGGFVSGWERCVRWYRERKKQRLLRAKAVENLSSLPPPYVKSLLWMYAFDERSISVEGNVGILETLAYQGYLAKDFPDDYHVVKTFRVPDEIWAEIQKLDRAELKRILKKNEPPWYENRWRT